MAGFTSPNYTQTPNIFFDEMVSQMKEAELKVALIIMRETFGWHRERRQMSLSYLMKATGLSKQGVLNGIADGVARGIIVQKSCGNSYEYSLVVNEIDQNACASQRSGLEVVNEVDHFEAEMVNEVDTTKKDIKKGETKLPPEMLGKRQQRQTPEHLKVARTFGLEPRDMTRLVNAVLDATGKRHIADLETTFGERELSYAQECAVSLIQMGVHEPEQVAAAVKAYEAEYPKFGTPSYRQLLEAAGKTKQKAERPLPPGSVRNADGSITTAFVPPVPAYAS